MADPQHLWPAAAALLSSYTASLATYLLHPLALYYDVVVPALESPAELLDQLLTREHPFVLSLHVLLAAIVYSFVVSTLRRDYSVVDRMWSVIPVVYAWIYVLQSRSFLCYRLVAIACLVTVWGVRLTWNFARKGGYAGEQDYRWGWIRAKYILPWGSAGEVAWHLFNLFFISAYQQILLWALVNPVMFVAWSVRYRPRAVLVRESATHVPWSTADAALVMVALGLILFETIADQQQWDFQQAKRALLADLQARLQRGVPKTPLTGSQRYRSPSSPTSDVKSRVDSNFPERAAPTPKAVDLSSPDMLAQLEPPYNLGFVSTGLFRYSRHPNFFAEMTFWCIVYLFAVCVQTSHLTLSYQINYPFRAAWSVAISHDWTTLYVFTRGGMRMLTVPLVQWCMAGCVNLILLFQGSTWLTERISRSKYPHYTQYARITSRFMPLPSPGMGSVGAPATQD